MKITFLESSPQSDTDADADADADVDWRQTKVSRDIMSLAVVGRRHKYENDAMSSVGDMTLDARTDARM